MASKDRRRLDVALVERKLAESREKAQALILAGKVTVDGHRSDKPGRSVSNASQIQVEGGPRYVSRGGLKLEAALQGFHVSPEGKVCLDIGTSTGGFTDCLLQHGAARVHAVDTGAGQIDWRLRTDPRVILHERTNARYLNVDDIGERVQIAVSDVSFISITLIIPAIPRILTAGADWIILVKPQFEVGREWVGPGGIVRDPKAHAFACERVQAALQDVGFVTNLMDSPILGSEGNREFLLHARRPDDQQSS